MANISRDLDLTDDGSASVDNRASETSSDDPKSIMVKISARAKGFLTSAANNTVTGPTTYAKVIEALLEHYGTQEPDLQEKILLGIKINSLQESEALLARLHRAEHAVVNKRYYYAIKIYKALAYKLRGANSSEELLDVCRYRLAHCWTRLSYHLRVDALADDIGKHGLADNTQIKKLRDRHADLYKTADAALLEALRYLEMLADGGDPLLTLIKHYNKACCYALRAQYLVEADPNLGSTFRSDLHNARKSLIETQKVWEVIGEYWRKTPDPTLADEQAMLSLNELKRIFSTDDASAKTSRLYRNSDLKYGIAWCAGTATDDSDLLFLHSDAKHKQSFNEWKESALGEESLGEVVKALFGDE